MNNYQQQLLLRWFRIVKDRRGSLRRGPIFFWLATFIISALLGAACTRLIEATRPAAEMYLIAALLTVLALLLIRRIPERSRRGSIVVFAYFAITGVIFQPFLVALAGGSPGDLIPLLAAVAALATLILVQRQIDLASKQLDLARSELTLVKRDLEISQKQAVELARRPFLLASWPNGDTTLDLPFEYRYRPLNEQIRLMNTGDRTSHQTLLQVLVPRAVLERPQAENVTLEGQDFARYQSLANVPVYRGVDVDVEVLGNSTLIYDPPPFDVLWRVHDDFGSYPENSEWGVLQVSAREREVDERQFRYSRRAQGLIPPSINPTPGGKPYVFVSITPAATEAIIILDDSLREFICRLVESTPAFAGASEQIIGNGMRFQSARASTNSVWGNGAAGETCQILTTGQVEVACDPLGNDPLRSLLTTFGAAYSIAVAFNREIRSPAHANGHVSYFLPGLARNDPGNKFTLDLQADTFEAVALQLVLFARGIGAGQPEAAGVVEQIKTFWQSYEMHE